MGPVHLDLFQLDVAHSVVDCILSCLFLLCITFNVGSSVSLFLYLVLCMSYPSEVLSLFLTFPFLL